MTWRQRVRGWGLEEASNSEDCPHILASSPRRYPVGGGDVYGHAAVKKLVAAVLYFVLCSAVLDGRLGLRSRFMSRYWSTKVSNSPCIPLRVARVSCKML